MRGERWDTTSATIWPDPIPGQRDVTDNDEHLRREADGECREPDSEVVPHAFQGFDGAGVTTTGQSQEIGEFRRGTAGINRLAR